MRISNLVSVNSNIFNTYNRNNLYASNKTNKINFCSNDSLPDFVSKVDENCYRGRRPEKYEFSELKDMGITTVVNLATDFMPYDEKSEVGKYNMEYYEIPIRTGDEPNKEQLEQFLKIIDKVKKDNKKMYVHCEFGSDRTGLMVTLYQKYNDLPIRNPYIERRITDLLVDNDIDITQKRKGGKKLSN